MFRAWRAAGAGLVFLTLLAMPRGVQAIPMTFAFDMPAFTSGGFIGQTSVLEVTVDNGGTSAASQFYFSFGIDGFAVTLGAQTVSLGLDSAHGASYFGNHLYITTNAGGVPTLDLSRSQESLVLFSSPAGERISLSTGGYLSFSTYDVVFAGGRGSLQSDLVVTGRLVTAVAEPAGAALFAGGLALIAARCRRRRRPAFRATA